MPQSQPLRYNNNDGEAVANVGPRLNSSFVQKNSQLYMGDLDPSWDENTIRQIWATLGESGVEIKLMWNNNTSGLNAIGKRNNLGYCFVDFPSYSHASNALLKNGIPIPDFPSRILRLNWASSSSSSASSSGAFNNGLSVFVGDLAPNVTEAQLFELFISRYPSTAHAKVVYDQLTGVSKGYAFIRFGSVADQQRALLEMTGVFLNGRAIRVSIAGHQNQQTNNPRMDNKARFNSNTLSNGSKVNNSNNGHLMNSSQFMFPVQQEPPLTSFTDPNNTTVFIGGLSSLVTENQLRLYFQSFGQIVYVKIPVGKGCGFVQYVDRVSAELAISKMQGFPIGDSRIRMSWGRSAKHAATIHQSIIQNNTENQKMNQFQTQPQPVLQQPIYGRIPSTNYFQSNALQLSSNVPVRPISEDPSLLLPGYQNLQYSGFPHDSSDFQSPEVNFSTSIMQQSYQNESNSGMLGINAAPQALLSDTNSFVDGKTESMDRLENGSNGYVFA